MQTSSDSTCRSVQVQHVDWFRFSMQSLDTSVQGAGFGECRVWRVQGLEGARLRIHELRCSKVDPDSTGFVSSMITTSGQTNICSGVAHQFILLVFY